MNYNYKYLKYKNKYIKYKLLNNKKIIGGFYLNDDNHNYTFKYIILKLLLKINNSFKIIPRNDSLEFDKILESFNTDEYYNLYCILIEKFFINENYKQEFWGNSLVPFYTHEGMKSYHICFASLIFINYLIELELFTLVHNIIKVNTQTNINKNLFVTIFGHHSSTNPTRIYKNIAVYELTSKIDTLCTQLDMMFYKFMNNFIEKISKLYHKKIHEIFVLIVPIEHIEHDNRYDMIDNRRIFDFIYVNWKDRIRELNSTVTHDSLNLKLVEAIVELSSDNNKYIAEGVGFFSYINMINPSEPDLFFGSCITFSAFELYIMSRLHIDEKNMFLLIEQPSDKTPHAYWKITQEYSQISALSHWATEFDFSSIEFKLRSAQGTSYDGISYILGKKISFEGKNRISMIKLLTYPIFDSYIAYINKNSNIVGFNISKFNKIKKFIDSRLFLFEAILLKRIPKCDIFLQILLKDDSDIYNLEYIKETAYNNIKNNNDFIKSLHEKIVDIFKHYSKNIENIKKLLSNSYFKLLCEFNNDFYTLLYKDIKEYSKFRILFQMGKLLEIEEIKNLLIPNIIDIILNLSKFNNINNINIINDIVGINDIFNHEFYDSLNDKLSKKILDIDDNEIYQEDIKILLGNKIYTSLETNTRFKNIIDNYNKNVNTRIFLKNDNIILNEKILKTIHYPNTEYKLIYINRDSKKIYGLIKNTELNKINSSTYHLYKTLEMKLLPNILSITTDINLLKPIQSIEINNDIDLIIANEEDIKENDLLMISKDESHIVCFITQQNFNSLKTIT